MIGALIALTTTLGLLMAGLNAVVINLHSSRLRDAINRNLRTCPTPSLDLSAPIPPRATSPDCCSFAGAIPLPPR